MRHIVVVGAGQAGSSCVVKLRNDGFDGKITLIGAETQPPYQRPPLSKAYLMGDMALERLYLRPHSFYAEQGIELRLGVQVEAIDTAARHLTIEGAAMAYDDLVLTTGSVPHRLPAAIGGALDGVHVVRALADVDAMAHRFVAGARVLIVGGGYIGLEAASVAAKLGLHVTLVEMAPRILQRVAAPETSDFFRDLHVSHGVDLREGVGLERLTGEGAVSGAELTDGTALNVDFVIVGVGVAPATALAQAAGIVIDNGIAVDAQGRTSAPHVWAAGDCASFPYRGARIRLESVPNAIDQAELVAENLMGAGREYEAKPWFWSDQYDVKLQIAGLNTGYDRVVTRGAAPGPVSFWYYGGGTLLAVDAANDPRGYMVGQASDRGWKIARAGGGRGCRDGPQGPAAGMRIIAGTHRATKLAEVGAGDAAAHLRPTSDRVRESLFSMLTHLDVIRSARVLDLFAGTGALGLEALSRGAAMALFVENGRAGQKLIAENIERLGVKDTASILRSDATALGAWIAAPFDLVFLDPPYGKGIGAKGIGGGARRAGGSPRSDDHLGRECTDERARRVHTHRQAQVRRYPCDAAAARLGRGAGFALALQARGNWRLAQNALNLHA